MRIVSLTDATVLAVEGKNYHPDHAGVFTVPDEIGASLIGFPQWEEEYVYRARVAAEKEAHDRDPSGVLERLTRLEAQVAALSKPARKPRTSS